MALIVEKVLRERKVEEECPAPGLVLGFFASLAISLRCLGVVIFIERLIAAIGWNFILFNGYTPCVLQSVQDSCALRAAANDCHLARSPSRTLGRALLILGIVAVLRFRAH